MDLLFTFMTDKGEDIFLHFLMKAELIWQAFQLAFI